MLHFAGFELREIRLGTMDVDPTVLTSVLGSMNECARKEGTVPLGESIFLACGAIGRYVVVLLETMASMVLCEVEVFEGTWSPDSH